MIEALAAIGWAMAVWMGWKLRKVRRDWREWHEETFAVAIQNANYWFEQTNKLAAELVDIRADTPARGANGRFTKRGT